VTKYAALAAAFLLPSFALAAGFAKDPIFLSRSPVTEGQSVHVYAVLSNTDTTPFSGTAVFYDNDKKIGGATLTLAAGASQTASVLWTPTAGTHTVKAVIINKDNTTGETITESFTIQEKPKPQSAATSSKSNYTAATIDSSADLQAHIADFSPVVASTTEPVFSFIDSARTSAADALDSQIASTKSKVGTTPKPGIVAGTSDSSTFKDAHIENGATGIWYWVYSAYLWILLALRWLVGNAGVFYPFLAIALLYILWRTYRHFRRPY
jgi:hypothetical protein